MWRDHHRWLAREELALCFLSETRGPEKNVPVKSNLKSLDVFLKTKQQWLYDIYIYTNMYITGDLYIYIECDLHWFTVPQILGKQHCHIISQQHTITLAKMTSALSVWKLMMTPSAPARFSRNQPFNQRNKKKQKKKNMCGKWPWPCAVSSPQQKRSSPFEAKPWHAAMFPNFLLRRFYKHLKVLPCSTNPVSKCFGDVFTAELLDKNPVRMTFFVVAACDSHCEAQMGPASSAFLALVDR